MTEKESKFGEAFISYGSYHFNPVNQWIHIICVPIIAATMVCALSFVPLSYQFRGYSIGVDTIGVAVALAYYFFINITFGFGMLVLTLLMAGAWKLAFSGMEQHTFFIWVISIHIVAWVLQFIGHGVFQKRKPALLDNITQILNAPLFVLVEILQKLGIVSEEMKRWNQQIEKRVTQFRQSCKNDKQK